MESTARSELTTNLETAFVNEAEDPVSLVTIIDLYTSQVNEEGSRDDIIQYLEVLYKCLHSNHEITKEIGWDLPKILLDLFNDVNIDSTLKLTQNKIFTTVLRSFDEIAKFGNAKECLLTGCDLLSSLSFNPDEIQEENSDEAIYGDNEETEETKTEDAYTPKSNVEFIPNLKIHLIFSLLNNTLRRIDTLYPSKFLGMIISSILSLLKNNHGFMKSPSFILHRVYELLSQYHPSITPFDAKLEITQEEYDKIAQDEHDISLKLIQEFVTVVLMMSYKENDLDLDLIYYYYSFINKKDGNDNDDDGDDLKKVATQYNTLVKNFDIHVKDEFIKYLDEVTSIYEPVINTDANKDKTDSQLTQMIYQLSYTHGMKRSLDKKLLELNPHGLIILSGLYYIATKTSLITKEAGIDKIIYLYLSCSTASLYSPTYDNKGIESVSRYWLWVSLTQTAIQVLKDKLQNMSTIIIKVFLQMLLIKTCSHESEEVRKISFILLTRLLCLLKEDVSYDYIFDTLLTCPFVNAKISMIKILKDLMTKNSTTMKTLDSNTDVQTITKDLEQLDVKKGPSLPPRKSYISITDDRMAAIHSLAMMNIEKVESDLVNGDKSSLFLSLTYMNLFVGLRDKWNKDLLHVINESISEKIVQKLPDNDSIPELQFIVMANDTLKQFLAV